MWLYVCVLQRLPFTNSFLSNLKVNSPFVTLGQIKDYYNRNRVLTTRAFILNEQNLKCNKTNYFRPIVLLGYVSLTVYFYEVYFKTKTTILL